MRRAHLIENGSTYIAPTCQPLCRAGAETPSPATLPPGLFDTEAHAADCARSDDLFARVGIWLMLAALGGWIIGERMGWLS